MYPKLAHVVLQCVLVSLGIVLATWISILREQLKANDCQSMDQAIVQIIHTNTSIEYQTTVYYQYKECKNCEMFVLVEQTVPVQSIKLNSKYTYNVITSTWNKADGQLISQCQGLLFDLGECGQYQLEINFNSTCSLRTLKEPARSEIFLYVAALFLLFASLVVNLIEVYWGNGKKMGSKYRIYSLDAFRGLSLFWMIFFNYGSGGYKFLQHADWHGLTPADLVFPWFIWIMGFSIPISCRTLIEVKGHSRRSILKKTLARACKLFLTGLLIFSIIGPGVYDPHQIRLPGVLQRISICYLVVASFEIFAYKSPTKKGTLGYFYQIRSHLLFMVVCAATWTYFTLFFSIPNCPRAYMEPGGLHNFSQFFNCTGGTAGYLDNLILGESRLYKYGAIKVVYKNTRNYDPEGILLGTTSAIFLACLGAEAGRVTILFKGKLKHIMIWLCWATGLLAVFLTFFLNNEYFPVNKNLWTLSYSVITGSSAFLVMSMLYYCIDVRRWWTGNPFIYLGLNSILIYVLHYLFGRTFPVYFRLELDGHAYKLGISLWGSCFWTLVALGLHWKRIYFHF